MLNSINLLNQNDSITTAYKSVKNKDKINSNRIINFNENKFSSKISTKNLFKQHINEKIQNSDINHNYISESNFIILTDGNTNNNFNKTINNKIYNKKISDIPLLSSLNFNKVQKNIEFNSESLIKTTNILNTNNKSILCNNKLGKSTYFNSSNIFSQNKKTDEENNIEVSNKFKMAQVIIPLSNYNSKKNSQNNSKSTSKLDDFENKINLIQNYEENEINSKNKLIKVNNKNSLMKKFLPFTSNNSPKQIFNKDLIKNINLKKEIVDNKPINITTSYKLRDDSKNNEKNHHKFFLDLNKIKDIRNINKDNLEILSFDNQKTPNKNRILLETSNESIRSTLRESTYFRIEAEKLSNFIKNCKKNLFILDFKKFNEYPTSNEKFYKYGRVNKKNL